MNPRQRREEEHRRRRKEALIRRRRRRRRIHLTLILICLAALAGIVVYSVFRLKNRFGQGGAAESSAASAAESSMDEQPESAGSQSTSSEAESASGAEPSGTTTESPEDSAEESQPETGTPEQEGDLESAVYTIDNSEPWLYTTDAAMPDGLIVSTDSVHYTYEMMRRDLYLLTERYPDLVTVRKFGTTVDGRELLEAVVGSDDAQGDIIIQYSMHAREYINTLLGMKHLETLLAEYHTGSYNGMTYEEMLGKVRFHLIPMMNPDGVMISEEGIEAIESEELRNFLLTVYDSDLALGKASVDINEYWQTWKANARAVDLNRNFATDGWTTEMGTQQPSCTRYPGTGPNSEPEVQSLVSLADSMNVVCQIAYHSHGRLIYWDYGMAEKNPELYQTDHEIAEMMSALTGVQFDPYTVLSTVDDGQNPGGCSDYFMQILEVPAITIETGRKFKDDGSYNDPPLSIDNFQLIWAEQEYALPAIGTYFAERI